MDTPPSPSHPADPPDETDETGEPDRPRRRYVVRGLLGIAGSVMAWESAACTTATSGRPPTAAPRTTAAVSTSTAPSPSRTPFPNPSPVATPTISSLLATTGPDIQTGAAVGRGVALTFHGAGDPQLTIRVLAAVAAAGAKVTVFAVGQWLTAHPELGRAIVDQGHDLGNHTWSHQTMTRLSSAQAVSEIQRGAQAITAAVGHAGLLFRPSGTPRSTATIRAAALACGYHRSISYDVDPLDYQDPGADLVRTRTLAAIRPGSIVSLHLGHTGTVEALPGILQGVKARNLVPMPLRQLPCSA